MCMSRAQGSRYVVVLGIFLIFSQMSRVHHTNEICNDYEMCCSIFYIFAQFMYFLCISCHTKEKLPRLDLSEFMIASPIKRSIVYIIVIPTKNMQTSYGSCLTCRDCPAWIDTRSDAKQ